MVDIVSAFQIEELEGDGRLISLIGRALPYRPFELTTAQRVEITWLPGSPIATSTVLGSKEEAHPIRGFWKDRFLSGGSDMPPITVDGSPVATVSAASELLDSVVRAGQVLEVTWLDQLRHGHLLSFRKIWHNAHDLEWEMEFTWTSRGEEEGPAAFAQQGSTSSASAALRQCKDDLDNISSPPFGISLDILSNIVDIAHQIEDRVSAIEDTIINIKKSIMAPINGVKSVIAECSSLVDEARWMQAYVTNCPPGSTNASKSMAEQTMGEKLQESAWRREIAVKARALATEALARRDSIRAQQYSAVVAKYIARDGDDLRDVSRLYYGTPAHWRDLMIYNSLSEAELTAGQIVLVPSEATIGAPIP